MTYLLASANARTGTKIYAALAATAALAFVSASDVLAQGVPQQNRSNSVRLSRSSSNRLSSNSRPRRNSSRPVENSPS